MPLIVPKRIHRSHAVLPITFATTTSLVLALCYLQLIYLVSHLLRPIWSSHRDFPPLRQNIERVEKLVVDLIMGIVPSSTYRSPAPTGLIHEEPLGHRIASAVHSYTSRAALDNAPHPRAGFITPPNLPQCYPENALERTMPNNPDYRLEAAKSPLDRLTNRSSSVYDTVKRNTSVTQSKVSSIAEAGPVTVQQLTRSSISLRRYLEPEDGAGAEWQVPERPPNTPSVSHKSPGCSMDGPSDLTAVLEAASTPTVEPEPENEDEDGLKLARDVKCRSTESYPGKFPVSEGMEFSSLATASYAFRERGTTTVRPFSDY